MSLKAEQILFNNFITNSTPKVYTTGVKLVPLEVNINKKKKYVWVADEFNGDNYDKIGKLCNLNVISDNLENLIENNGRKR